LRLSASMFIAVRPRQLICGRRIRQWRGSWKVRSKK